MPWNSEVFRYSRALMLLNGPAIQRNCSGYRDLEIIFSLLERMSFSNCLISSCEKQAFMDVSIVPQAMAFTAMLLGASSFPRAWVNAFSPPLVVLYATSQEAPLNPHMDEMLIICPCLLLTICGMISLQQLKTEVRLV